MMIVTYDEVALAGYNYTFAASSINVDPQFIKAEIPSRNRTVIGCMDGVT
jgi:hypothetical protein